MEPQEQRRNLVSKPRGSLVWGRGPGALQTDGPRGATDLGSPLSYQEAESRFPPLGLRGKRRAGSHPEVPATRPPRERLDSLFSLPPGSYPSSAEQEEAAASTRAAICGATVRPPLREAPRCPVERSRSPRAGGRPRG